MILPIDIGWDEWASQIRIDLPMLYFPNPPGEEEWRGWAAQVVSINKLKNVPLPTEIGYPDTSDWKTWACYFVGSQF